MLTLLLPALIPLLILTIYPALYAVYLSMTNEALTGLAAAKPRFVGAANYFRLFSDARFWNSLFVPFVFVVGSARIGQFVVGFISAIALRRKVVGSSVFGAAILLPNAAPEVVAGFMWISMLAGGDHATLSKIMMALARPQLGPGERASKHGTLAEIDHGRPIAVKDRNGHFRGSNLVAQHSSQGIWRKNTDTPV